MPRQPVSVPCDGCTACCKNELVILHPEDGDIAARYRTRHVEHPFIAGKIVDVLLHKDNAECFYLGASGCTIYATRPAMCKSFDCRKLFSLLTSKERREHGKDPIMKTRLDAGKKRLWTL